MWWFLFFGGLAISGLFYYFIVRKAPYGYEDETGFHTEKQNKN